jgi:hypothetical protein
MLCDSRFFFHAPPLTHTPFSSVFAGHECKFAAPFDKNGAGYYIGTNGNTEDFENPHSTGEVVAAMSSIRVGGPSHLVEQPHDGSTCNYTEDEPNSRVSLDLGEDRSLVPNYYCLRHGFRNGDYRLKSWNFEGSNDGSSYTVLRAHRNDNSLPNKAFSVAAWKVEEANQAYRYFRIRQTGKNSGWDNDGSGSHRLYCAGIELYGMVALRKQDAKALAAIPPAASAPPLSHRADHQQAGVLPPHTLWSRANHTFHGE